MKQKILFFLVLSLVLSFAFVQASNSTQPNKSQNTTNQIKKLPKNLTKNLKNVTQKFEEFIVPEPFETFTKIVFRVPPKEKVYVDRFIVLWSLFAGFVIVLMSILKLTALFQTKAKQVLGAFFISLVIGAVGVINSISNFFFNFSDTLKFLSKLGPFSVLLLVAFFFAVIFVTAKLMNKLETTSKLKAAEERGRRLGRLDAYAKAREEALVEMDKKLAEGK